MLVEGWPFFRIEDCMKIFYVLLVLSMLAGCDRPSKVASTFPDQYFTELQSGSLDKAFTLLVAKRINNTQLGEKNAWINSMAQQLRAYGPIDAWEKISFIKKSDRYEYVSYYLYQKTGMSRWNFYFYFTEGEWQLLNIDARSDNASF